MSVYLHTKAFKSLLVLYRSLLAVESRENNTADEESVASECIDKSKNIHIICNTEITTNLVLLDIICINDDYDLSIFLKLCKHSDLTVRSKSRKYS